MRVSGTLSFICVGVYLKDWYFVAMCGNYV